MILANSILKQTSFAMAPLSQSCLRPKGQKHKRNILADLMLTSLVDALSILVIYLLMSFSNTGEILYISKNMQLPNAKHSTELIRTLIVKFEQGQFYVEDRPVKPNDMTEALLDAKKNSLKVNVTDDSSLTVQADRETPYELLSQVVQAGSQAGFSEIKFAVLQK